MPARDDWRQITVQCYDERPGHIDALELLRNDLRSQGHYSRAGQVQGQIEDLKASEDLRRCEVRGGCGCV